MRTVLIIAAVVVLYLWWTGQQRVITKASTAIGSSGTLKTVGADVGRTLSDLTAGVWHAFEPDALK